MKTKIGIMDKWPHLVCIGGIIMAHKWSVTTSFISLFPEVVKYCFQARQYIIAYSHYQQINTAKYPNSSLVSNVLQIFVCHVWNVIDYHLFDLPQLQMENELWSIIHSTWSICLEISSTVCMLI